MVKSATTTKAQQKAGAKKKEAGAKAKAAPRERLPYAEIIFIDLDRLAREPERYPLFAAEFLGKLKAGGTTALGADYAKELVGWQNDGKTRKPTSLYQDANGDWITFTKNAKQRPFRRDNFLRLRQKVLHNQWEFNGEPLIVSDYGNGMSIQHRVAALIDAELVWNGEENPYYRQFWPEGPPVMECKLVQGIPETEKVLATIDDVMAATPADMYYKEGYFPKAAPRDREVLCKVLERAVKVLWDRTGVARYPGSRVKQQTLPQLLEFAGRHGRLEKAVAHVYEENQLSDEERKEKKAPKIAGLVTLGAAAALQYLMGAGGTDGDRYRAAGDPGQWSESKIDWGKGNATWDKAQEFWVCFAGGTAGLDVVRKVLKDLEDPATGVIPDDKRWATLANAWQLFSSGSKLTPAAVRPKLLVDADLQSGLDPANRADFCGIDYTADEEDEDEKADAEDKAAEEDEAEDTDDPADPSEEELEAAGRLEDEELANGAVDGDDDLDDHVEALVAPKRKGRGKGKAAQDNGEPSAPAEPKTFAQSLEDVKEQHNGSLILYKRGSNYAAWGEDARTAASALKLGRKKQSGVDLCEFPVKDLDKQLGRLRAALGNNKIVVLDDVPEGM